MSDPEKPTAVERPPPASEGEPRALDATLAQPSEHPKRTSAHELTLPDKPHARVRERREAPPERYVEGDEIARGGMGRVALATDTLLERVVAVKQALSGDRETLRRFARETKITARLEHPSIVPVYDAGTDGDVPYYVMRRVSGRPLADLILESATLEARLALVPNLLAAAQAIAHAHTRRIVHRDIKPANILVGDLGETVVIDWGLAKVIDDDDPDDPIEASPGDSLRTRAGTVFGTPGFMSPGQLRGEPVGVAADVYALGATLYFVLAGRPPHMAKTGEAMMALAAEGPPEPLVELVPGVPRELATIVDTALAYGDHRYRDAAELADELQRYTTGQLVASHHYGARERLVRFVRKNRAAVAIAFIAVLVIAISTTLSFRRVVEERDRADDEAREAHAAQQRERERVDQLLLLRARMLLDTNPTHAVAVLAELAPDSPRTAEAHGLVNAAVLRGVARGIPAPNRPTIVAEIDPTGRFLVQSTLDGYVRVWDLLRETEVLAKLFRYGVHARWVGAKLLVAGLTAPALLDPATGRVDLLGISELRSTTVSDDGELILGELDDRTVVRIDLAARTATPVWPGHATQGNAMAGDGSWYAVYDSKELVVFGRDGSVVMRHAGEIGHVIASHSKKLAFSDRQQLVEIEVGAQPTLRTVDHSKFHRLVTMLAFRGDELLIGVGSGHLLVHRDGRVEELGRPGAWSASHGRFADGGLMFLAGDNAVVLTSELRQRTIALPQTMANARIASRRGARRFAVVGNGLILVYDLHHIWPELIPAAPKSHAQFFDNTTLVISDDELSRHRWRDLATGKETPFVIDPKALSQSFAFDPTSGLAIIELFRGSSGSELYRVRKHSSEAVAIHTGNPITGFDVLPGGDVVFTSGSDLLINVDGKTRTLATTRSPLRFAHALPDRRVATVSDDGELLRGPVTGEIERVQVPKPPSGPAVDQAGRRIPPITDVHAGAVYVAWGSTIWRWGERFERWRETDAAIYDLRAIRDHLMVLLAGNRILSIEIATGKLHTLPPHGGHVAFGTDLASAAIDIGGFYHFVELSSGTVWPTPITRLPLASALARHGDHAVVRLQPRLYLWRIPDGSGPLRARVAPYTNAKNGPDDLLIWAR